MVLLYGFVSFYNAFTMVLLWFYYGFAMALLWFYYGFVSFYNAFTMLLLWFYYGFYKDDNGMNLGYGWIYHLE